MERVLVIAEAGVNHNGDIEKAKEMVDIASDAGADIVKFQTFNAEYLTSKFAQKAAYQNKTTDAFETQKDMLMRLALLPEQHKKIAKHCKQKNIQFLSTPFDLDSIEFLQSIDMLIWKIPSGEITNLPYLLKIASIGKDIIMSTGMCMLNEVKQAVNILKDNGSGKITLLHCNTEYPTPIEDVNLNAMLTLKREFGLSIGYSDHTLGIEIPIAAAALGATVIEKHFTLDKNMEGPDHKASLEPDELVAMVKAIRNIEKAMGNGEKVPSKSETKNIDIARKSIVARTHIAKGQMFTEDNITVKRPGNGVSPMKWFQILGIVAKRDFEEDELIEL